MRLLTSVIDLPRSMYSMTPPREIRRKIARILAICLAILIYEIYNSTILAIENIVAKLQHFVSYICQFATNAIITPLLTRVITK